MKRSLKYWSMCAHKMMLAIVACVVLYDILNFMSSSHNNSVMEAISMTPLYVILIGCTISFIAQASYISYSVPTVISFGSLRKETVFGIQCMNIILTVESYIIFVITSIVFPDKIGKLSLIMYLGIFMLMVAFTAVGQFVGTVMLRFGKIGTVLFVVFLMLCGGICGAVFGILGSGSLPTINMLIFTGSAIKVAIIIIVPIIVYLLGMFSMYCAIKKYEVKR